MPGWKELAALLALLMLGGCNAQPYAYHSDREIPKGPGLMSGEDGVFEAPLPGTSGD